MNDVSVGYCVISPERLLPSTERDERTPAKIRTDEEAAATFGWLLDIGMELAAGADIVIPDFELTAGASVAVEADDDTVNEEDVPPIEFTRLDVDIRLFVPVVCLSSPPSPIANDELVTFCG